MGYLYVLGCILFTVYGQLVLKWRMNLQSHLPDGLFEKIIFLLKLLLDPWLMTGFVSAFIASLFWMAAMTKFELSFAYPFMSLSFVLVFILSYFIFGEAFTWGKVLGLILITSGIFVSVKL